MQSWLERHEELVQLARRQLFFVDGQPRSGTTWLQQMLDAHPEVSCRGEAMFRDGLAVPLDRVVRDRHRELDERNRSIFAHTGGYPLPDVADTQFLLGTAILQAFRQQAAGSAARAIGEKTPANLFFFPQLLSLFPQARLVSIARDPRDMITSNWHRFQNNARAGEREKLAFVERVLPVADRWMRTMLEHRTRYPEAFRIVTYETLHRAPEPTLAGLFRFLGVSDDPALVTECVAATRFERLSGRAAGTERNGAFFRKGVVGDWPATLSPAMNDRVLQVLGWSFETFGWTA